MAQNSWGLEDFGGDLIVRGALLLGARWGSGSKSDNTQHLHIDDVHLGILGGGWLKCV